MADAASTLTTANGWAKEIFGDVQRLSLPKSAKASKRIKFNAKKKLGKALEYPVWLSSEGGFTEGPGSTLNEARTAISKEASLEGNQTTLRGLIDIDALASQMNDKDSFGNYLTEHMLQSKRSFARRLETNVVYGGAPIATFTGAGSLSGASTTRTIVIPDAYWAPHIFLGAATHQFDVYLSTAKVNALAAVEITSVNLNTRTLVVSGNSTDLGDLDTAWNSGAGVIDMYWRGAYSLTMKGLYTIGSTTSSTTYAGINHATYPDAWQGSQVAVGSVKFDWNKLNAGLDMAAGKGCECGLIVQVSLKTWCNLLEDISALRVFDSSYKAKEGEFGVESIKFHGVTGQPVIVEPSGFVKRGHVIGFPNTDDEDFADLAERVGASDITIMHPNGKGEMMVQVPNSNFFETKFWTKQAVRVNPRDLIVWTGIVPE